MVLTKLTALYFFSGAHQWLTFSSNLPSKPRSPIPVYALCDMGSPWKSQWKLFTYAITKLRTSQKWTRLERHKWGDVFDILKRPRLVRGLGNRILMVGGLKSSFSLITSCSTILILRMDLDSLESNKAGRMPLEMFRCFQEPCKFKLFGGGDRVCFSTKKVVSWLCGTIALGMGSGGGLTAPPAVAMVFTEASFSKPGLLHCPEFIDGLYVLGYGSNIT